MFDFKFDWSEEVKCGVEILDAQHKELFHIGRNIESFIINNCMNVTNDQLLNIVLSLRDFVSYHVYTKEMLMKKYNYPEQSRLSHSLYIFRNNIITIDMYELGTNPIKVLIKLKEDLQSFLFDHILVESNELGKYLNSCGVY